MVARNKAYEKQSKDVQSLEMHPDSFCLCVCVLIESSNPKDRGGSASAASACPGKKRGQSSQAERKTLLIPPVLLGSPITKISLGSFEVLCHFDGHKPTKVQTAVTVAS